MNTIEKPKIRKTKRLFLKLGSCSRTVGYIVNKEFGNPREDHERALDPLAGGILQQGYQCGMLWGSSLAAGAAAYKRLNGQGIDNAFALTIAATQHIMKSFSGMAKHCDCIDITKCDWHNKWSIAKYFATGKMISCFRLLEKWAPEAVVAAHEGLSIDKNGLPGKCKSCASEVVRRMGGSEEEMAMVAGWAGGIGLSGNACGALAAAIWMRTLALCKETPGKSFFTNSRANETLELFYKETNYEILCSAIAGRRFETLDDHTEFIGKGGCKRLIEVLGGK
ncbi:MAG: C-GCAxxG-C-C family protein [Bacteroidetes bacterium]|nr:C-GCAxxG-C-C family protein [Bacteroidota bacterium]